MSAALPLWFNFLSPIGCAWGHPRGFKPARGPLSARRARSAPGWRRSGPGRSLRLGRCRRRAAPRRVCPSRRSRCPIAHLELPANLVRERHGRDDLAYQHAFLGSACSARWPTPPACRASAAESPGWRNTALSHPGRDAGLALLDVKREYRRRPDSIPAPPLAWISRAAEREVQPSPPF
jgi:hypothetical protein